MKKASARGLFERPAGSGCWWINYYVDGKQHREKVGRRGDALALYQKRKADSRRKLKHPELVPGKVITFGHLSEMAVNHAETHLSPACSRCSFSPQPPLGKSGASAATRYLEATTSAASACLFQKVSLPKTRLLLWPGGILARNTTGLNHCDKPLALVAWE